MPRTATRWLAVACGVAWTGAASAREVPPRIASIVPLLDAPELAVRERAAADLVDPAMGVTLEHVESLLTGELSPEQRVRLTALARELFRSLPRGALGIRWNANQDPAQPGLVIEQVLEGFDAHAKLRAQDRIIDIDRRQIIRPDDVRAAILSRVPGDEMTVTVEREGRMLEVSVRLGDQTALFDNRLPPDLNPYLDQAFRLRAARWPAPSSRGVIPTGLADDQWLAPDDPEARGDDGMRSLRIALDRLAAPTLLPGGQARDAADRVDLLSGGDSWQLAMQDPVLRPQPPAWDAELQRRREGLRALLDDAHQRLIELEHARAAATDDQQLRAIMEERSRIDALRFRISNEVRRLEQAALVAQQQLRELEP